MVRYARSSDSITGRFCSRPIDQAGELACQMRRCHAALAEHVLSAFVDGPREALRRGDRRRRRTARVRLTPHDIAASGTLARPLDRLAGYKNARLSNPMTGRIEPSIA